jgi:hypothetical protein
MVRVPLADGTLVATPDVPPEDMVPSLLALSDVMGRSRSSSRNSRTREKVARTSRIGSSGLEDRGKGAASRLPIRV